MLVARGDRHAAERCELWVDSAENCTAAQIGFSAQRTERVQASASWGTVVARPAADCATRMRECSRCHARTCDLWEPLVEAATEPTDQRSAAPRVRAEFTVGQCQQRRQSNMRICSLHAQEGSAAAPTILCSRMPSLFSWLWSSESRMAAVAAMQGSQGAVRYGRVHCVSAVMRQICSLSTRLASLKRALALCCLFAAPTRVQ